MTVQIKELVLYGVSGEVRRLKFKLGALNVITGKSRTGKSAIIDIVDYCLGRSTFRVFEGVNRDVVSWYGLLLQLNESQVFIAKPAPKDGAVSQSGAYFKRAATIDIPSADELFTNSNDEALIEELSGLLRISPNLHIPPEGQTRAPLEVTIAHAKLFNFLEQGEVASRTLLFHRQGEQFFPQTIKDALPYFLGVISEDYLANVHAARDLRKRLRALEKRESDAVSVRGAGSVQAFKLLLEARQMGLVGDFNGSAPDDVRKLLVQALQWRVAPYKADDYGPSEVDISRDLEEARRTYREARDQLAQVKYFEKEADNFGEQALEQSRRLQSVELFAEIDGLENLSCPLCGEVPGITPPTLSAIRGNLRKLNDDLGIVETQRPRLREFADKLSEKVSGLREKTAALTDELEARALASDAEQAYIDLNTRKAIVAGRISLYLESMQSLSVDASLQQEIESIRAKLSILEDALDQDEVAVQLTSTLNRIGASMTNLAEDLQLEFAGSPYRLDLVRLTVVADTVNRAIPMDRMGSGENWLGCHLIALLALHRHFIEHNRPIPGFLILDQPSQVYFPSVNDYRALDGTDESFVDSNADREAVTRMFKLLVRTCMELAPNLQIIVTEHANLPDDWFQNSLVEDPWHNGRALIPESWLQS